MPYINEPKNMISTDKLNFGKYKGKTIEQVLEIDPSYLRWAVDNDVIKVSKSMENEIETACRADDEDHEYGGLDEADFTERD